MSDGSASPNRLGWGALVADAYGILSTTCGGVACDMGYSLAAEWAGKWAAIELAQQLAMPRFFLPPIFFE